MKEDPQMLSWKEEIDTWRVAADHAFVDGVFVETDTFYDFSPNRVFPILREEQPLMWLLIREEIRRLRKERGDETLLTVLDIGAGSGFFSLLCAKMGCFVAAIDNNPRAIDFSVRNAKTNSVPLTQSDLLEESEVQTIAEMFPNSGEIHLFKGDMASLKMAQGGFDIVLLSPPYNPTHPHLVGNVAQHAFAGTAGQSVFDRQIELVKEASWIAVDGVCVLNHNSTCSLPERELAQHNIGNLHAVQHIESKLGTNVAVALYPGLSTTISIEEFLERQYADIRDSLNRESEYSFEEYSADVVKSDTSFAYIFAVIRWPKSPPSVPVTLCRWQHEMDPENLHSRDWHDRIDAHRRIVNITPRIKIRRLRSELPGTTTLSLAQLLSPHASGTNLRSYSAATNEPPLPSGVFGIRFLQELDNYIKRERLEQRFPVILVNASPMNGQSQELITHQLGVWGKLMATEALEEVDRRIAVWDNIIRRLHAAEMAPFTHPAFCGTLSPKDDPWWPRVFVSESQFQSEIELPRNILKSYRQLLQQHPRRRNSRQQQKGTQSSYGVDSRWAYWAETLARLGNYDFGRSRKEAEKRILELLSVDSPTFEDLNDDAMLIHRLIHELADSGYISAATKSNSRSLRSWLIGIPLGHLFSRYSSEVSDLPSHYKGAMWLYMATTSDAEKDTKAALWNFVLYAWLLVTGMYDAEWEAIDKEISELWGISTIEQELGHEVIKRYAPALSLLHSLDKFLSTRGPKWLWCRNLKKLGLTADIVKSAMFYGILLTPTNEALASLRRIDGNRALRLSWQVYFLSEILGETTAEEIIDEWLDEIFTMWTSHPKGWIALSDEGFFEWLQATDSCDSGIPALPALRTLQLLMIILTNGIKHQLSDYLPSGSDARLRINDLYELYDEGSFPGHIDVSLKRDADQIVIRVGNDCRGKNDWNWREGTPHAVDLTCRLFCWETGKPYSRDECVWHGVEENRYIIKCVLPL